MRTEMLHSVQHDNVREVALTCAGLFLRTLSEPSRAVILNGVKDLGRCNRFGN